MVQPNETKHTLEINIYMILFFLTGISSLFNPLSVSTACAIMSWALLFAVCKTDMKNHPNGWIAKIMRYL